MVNTFPIPCILVFIQHICVFSNKWATKHKTMNQCMKQIMSLIDMNKFVVLNKISHKVTIDFHRLVFMCLLWIQLIKLLICWLRWMSVGSLRWLLSRFWQWLGDKKKAFHNCHLSFMFVKYSSSDFLDFTVFVLNTCSRITVRWFQGLFKTILEHFNTNLQHIQH